MKKSVSITFFWVVVFAINVVAQPRIEQDPNTHREVLRNKSTGKLLIPMEFDDIQPFYWLDSVLVVKKDGLKGAYDPSGKLLVPIQYRDILMFRPDNGFAPGYVMVTSEPAGKRKYGLYRLGEGLVLPEKYETVAPVFTDLFSGRVYMDTVIQFFFRRRQTFVQSAGPGRKKHHCRESYGH
ncbi:MAG: WG repeat-containing protein [Saprospiraceae bacterium]|nr:WG repeat-containing protein [Saprospiraceae bacterium]